MAVSLDGVAPVAYLPLILGVLRKLEVETLINSMVPSHPDQVVSAGRVVEALGLAILDGHHALYKVGRRLDERGMLPLLQPSNPTPCMTRAWGRPSMPYLPLISVRSSVRLPCGHWTSIPGNKGEAAVPTTTVIFESFATVTRVELTLDGTPLYQLHGWKAHHDQVCQALGLDHLIYDVTDSQKNNQAMPKGP